MRRDVSIVNFLEKLQKNYKDSSYVIIKKSFIRFCNLKNDNSTRSCILAVPTNPIGCCVIGGGTKPCDWLCSWLISLSGTKGATEQRHQDLLNIHKLSLCHSRIGDWAAGAVLCVVWGWA